MLNPSDFDFILVVYFDLAILIKGAVVPTTSGRPHASMAYCAPFMPQALFGLPWLSQPRDFVSATTGLLQPGVKRSSAGVKLLGLILCVFE